jgi:hypothetical protein
MRVHYGILATAAVAILSAGAANAQFDAYTLPAPPALSGNQAFIGSLGLEFTVISDIEVLELGAFDSGQQGILGANGLFTQIYQRTGVNTGVPVGPVVNFSSADPGALDNAYRFKPIAPLLLTAGNTYLVVSWGYSISDRNGNIGNAGNAFPVPTTNTGGGLVSYGRSYFTIVPNAFPITQETTPAGTPRYGAGNFSFRAEFVPPPQGGAPEPGTFALLGVGAVAMVGIIRRKRK